MTRNQLRAARELLVLQQEVLAREAKVGIKALRRFESGNGIAQESFEALQRVIEDQGVILVEPGTSVRGVEAGEGVVLKVWSVVLRLCPTWFLQRELSGREGVTAECFGPEDSKDFHVEGPCWVTVNRD